MTAGRYRASVRVTMASWTICDAVGELGLAVVPADQDQVDATGTVTS
ncbi:MULTISPECIES: hypothetical protein [unclassified Streptomyces]|nr:hypothetical protein [Streptomyces sp. Sge12]